MEPQKRFNGTVISFCTTTGYGFISYADGPNVFVHHSNIKTTPQILYKDQRVIFNIIQNSKGLNAIDVYVQEESE